MPFAEIALIMAIVTLGACVQGSLGFGMALIAAPTLALIDPRLVPGPLTASSLLLVTMIAIRDRAHADFTTVRWVIVGCAGGAATAATVISLLDPRGFALLFAALVLLAVGLSLLGLNVRVTPGTTFSAGWLGGFMGTTSSIGGPAVALVYQNEEGARFRGTLAAYFIVSCLINLTALASIGRFGIEEIRLAGLLVPGQIAGFIASLWLSRWIAGIALRPAILGLSTAAAMALLVRVLTQ